MRRALSSATTSMAVALVPEGTQLTWACAVFAKTRGKASKGAAESRRRRSMDFLATPTVPEQENSAGSGSDGPPGLHASQPREARCGMTPWRVTPFCGNTGFDSRKVRCRTDVAGRCASAPDQGDALGRPPGGRQWWRQAHDPGVQGHKDHHVEQRAKADVEHWHESHRQVLQHHQVH